MEIAQDKAVAMDYTLTDGHGTLIDSSEGREPLWFLYGHGNIIPGLEAALDGRRVGESVSVVVAPGDGYGEEDEQLIQSVPRHLFPQQINVGMQFQAQTDDGPRLVTVIQVTDEEVTVDGNHPLAGVTLHFDVTVREVRDATTEELAHGHIHGPGGHHH